MGNNPQVKIALSRTRERTRTRMSVSLSLEQITATGKPIKNPTTFQQLYLKILLDDRGTTLSGFT